jgi:hypothetical protein
MENLGLSHYQTRLRYPTRMQFSSLTILSDGKFDITIGGNLYSSEEETTRLDAGRGLLLAGNGSGGFFPISPFNSGLYLSGDVKDLKEIKIGAGKFIIASRNRDSLQFVKTLDKMP